ncbi:MAG: alpha/beta hydrolase, partial [Dermatophilaceae bacterium]
MTTTVAGMGDNVQSLADLRDQVTKMSFDKGDTTSVAGVVWLDYSAPQTIVQEEPVVVSGAARDGGRDLASFVRGVNASRVTDPDLSVLGHSYGSTTTGYALQHPGTGVDRAVLFGSPGISTDDVTDLHIPTDAIWYAEAPGDPVADAGRFGADPSDVEGLTQLETRAASTPGGERLAGVTGHSEYLQGRSTSQHNLAAIIAGHPEAAITGGPGTVDDIRYYAQQAGLIRGVGP